MFVSLVFCLLEYKVIIISPTENEPYIRSVGDSVHDEILKAYCDSKKIKRSDNLSLMKNGYIVIYTVGNLYCTFAPKNINENMFMCISNIFNNSKDKIDMRMMVDGKSYHESITSYDEFVSAYDMLLKNEKEEKEHVR